MTVIATVRTMRMKGIGLTAATGASREGGGVAEAAEVCSIWAIPAETTILPSKSGTGP